MERDILERKGGPMEELEHIGRISELLQWGDLRMPESAVGFLDELPQLSLGDFVRGNIEGQDLNGEVDE